MSGRKRLWALSVGVAAAGIGIATTVPAVAGLSAPVVGEESPATAMFAAQGVAMNSPMLAVDPTDSRFVVLAHRQDAPEFGCGLQVSGNGGLGFVPANPVPTLPPGAERCYAPEVAFDRHGKLYYLFIGLHGQGNNPMGIFLTTSTDNGRTFDTPRQLLGPSNYQVRMAIDRSMGNDGRIHLVWLKAANDDLLGGLPPADNPLLASHSDDGGKTFSTPVRVSDPARPRSIAPALAVGADHRVHVTYYDLRDDVRDYQGLEGPAWDGAWSVVATTSSDGGKTFAPSVVVDDAVVPPGRVMLIYTMAPPTLAVADGDGGNLYTAWWDSRAGNADVYLSRSTDGGRVWSEPLRVNDDASGGAKADQYLPRVSVAPGGRVDVLYLDRRNDPNNVRNDVYFTYSTDGGRTFAASTKVTSEPSDSRVGQRYQLPSAQGQFEFGNRLGLVSTRAGAIGAWPDTRNALLGSADQSVFTSRLTFPGESDGEAGGAVPAWAVGVGITGIVAVIVMGTIVLRRRASVAAQ